MSSAAGYQSVQSVQRLSTEPKLMTQMMKRQSILISMPLLDEEDDDDEEGGGDGEDAKTMKRLK